MGSSLIKNIDGSNPSVRIPASDSMRMNMSASNPSLNSHISEPSISSVTGSGFRKRSRFLPIVLVSLLIFSMMLLVAGLIHLRSTNKQRLAEVEQQEKLAAETKHITAQPLRAINEVVEDVNTQILFSIYSTPDGADVYKDGLFIGKTPIDQMKFARNTEEDAHIVVSLDGYQIYRNDISLADNFVENVSLEQIIVVKRQRPSNTADSAGKSDEKPSGVIINKPKTSKNTGTVITPPSTSEIALPD